MLKAKSKNNSLFTARNILLITLFLAAFLERTVFDLGPNYELLTTAMVLATYFLGGKASFLLTFSVIALTDRIIGNTNIFLFTWSGFLIPALFAAPLLKKLITNHRLQIVNSLKLIFTGLSANVFFYLWSNFGVWFLDSWGMYAKNLPGLIRCYINALPFLKNQAVSSLVFIPLGYILIETAFYYLKKLSLRSLPQIHKSSQ